METILCGRAVGCVFWLRKGMRYKDAFSLRKMRVILSKIKLLVISEWEEKSEGQSRDIEIWEEGENEREKKSCVIKLPKTELLLWGF